MNKYLKAFLHRGLIFGGFGPVVAGIVFLILGAALEGFSLSGSEVFLAIVSTYILAFVQAGASVFNQIEEWPVAKSVFFHFILIYFAYVACYTLNSWIPFEPMVIVIFTLAFALAYAVIWLTVYLCIKATEKRLNAHLN